MLRVIITCCLSVHTDATKKEEGHHYRFHKTCSFHNPIFLFLFGFYRFDNAKVRQFSTGTIKMLRFLTKRVRHSLCFATKARDGCLICRIGGFSQDFSGYGLFARVFLDHDVTITNIQQHSHVISEYLNERLVYPRSRSELETAIRELSLRHNREGYPEQPYDDTNTECSQ